MTTWNWNATLIHQDTAAANFPTITGAGESVVVMDTGAYNSHPALTGKTIIWKDFVGSTTSANDTDGHGTAITGVLAGNGFTFDDGTYGQGVSPGVNLIVLKTDDGVTKSWATQATRISAALDWVIANRTTYNIVAINLSTGSNQTFTDTALTGDHNLALDQSLSTKFATLTSDGVFIGAAAGNDGATKPDTVEYPAADANVYSASSVNSSGSPSGYASRGVLNDLWAPGENVVAPYYFPNDPNNINTYYINYAIGTSFSVPQMVGTAALIKQINPNFTPAEIISILKNSGTNITDPSTGHTFPLLNVDAALQMAEQMTNALNNHTFGTAAALNFSGNVAQRSGLTSISQTRDYYSFTLPASALVTFVDSTSGSQAAPSLNLYDVNGNLISNVDGGRSVSLSAGNYFLTADGGVHTETYFISLHRTQSSFNNHTAGTAEPITISSGSGSASGATLLANVPDYYTFTVSQQSNVTVQMQYQGGDSTNASLLNSSGTTLATIASGGTTQSLAAGTYYVLVTSPTNLANTYGVAVSATSTVINNGTPGANATIIKTAYDPYGRLCVAYYDSVAARLKFAMRSADGQTWSAITTIDSTPGAGQQLSLAIDVFGNPAIAYYDTNNGRLKFARFNGTTWSTSIVDANGVTGWQPSLTFNSVGVPYIAYFQASLLDLRVATLSGSKWIITTVDSKGNVGFVPSIAYDRNTNTIGVAYQDLTHSWYKYASTTGKGWTIRTVDTTTNAAGGSLSLGFDSVNQPEMVYNDAYNLNLKYAKFNGSVWNVSQVGGSSHGMDANLKFDAAGNPDVFFNNFFAGYSERDTLSNGFWSTTPITGGATGLVAAVKDSSLTTLSWITNTGAVFLDV